VERSEYLSRQLTRRGIPHNVLNAKFHEQEAQIIAEAGRSGAVTVATNMAGRGTDVVLGGNPDIIADTRLRKQRLDPVETPDEYEAAWDEVIETVRAEVAADAEKVRESGGLYVLGTERHESRRIDNQLRGRSGRQGDPGESRFYLSLGDELMRRFNGAALETIMNRVNLPDDVPIEAKMVTRAIRSAQTQVEQQNFEIRKNVLKYDEVMNEQRKVIYAERRLILEGEDHSAQVNRMIDEVIAAYVAGATAEGYVEDWDLDQLWTAIRTLYPIDLDPAQIVPENDLGEREDISAEELTELLQTDAHKAYAEREKEIDGIAGEGAMRQLERTVLLSVLDRKWRDHLYEMDYLREGIHLRSMAQRDPVVEYQREGYDMFSAMLDAIKEESVGFLFNVAVEANPAPDQAPVAAPAQPAPTPAPAPRPLPTEEPVAAQSGRSAAPTALRAKGFEDEQRDLVYTGPAEGGGTREISDGADTAGVSASRRERRAAARQSGRSTTKPPKARRKR
jgi:preprotein translocase subunit SecA